MKTGIQKNRVHVSRLDSGLRRNDGYFNCQHSKTPVRTLSWTPHFVRLDKAVVVFVKLFKAEHVSRIMSRSELR